MTIDDIKAMNCELELAVVAHNNLSTEDLNKMIEALSFFLEEEKRIPIYRKYILSYYLSNISLYNDRYEKCS